MGTPELGRDQIMFVKHDAALARALTQAGQTAFAITMNVSARSELLNGVAQAADHAAKRFQSRMMRLAAGHKVARIQLQVRTLSARPDVMNMKGPRT